MDNYNIWVGKVCLLELFKDGERLVYTATIKGYDLNTITFTDKYGKLYSYKSSLVQQITEKEDMR